MQNSEALVDILVGGGVTPDKLQVAYFTDSDHSIVYNGANTFVYQQLAERLFAERIRDVGAQDSHQWRVEAEQPVAKRSEKAARRDRAISEEKADRIAKFKRSLQTTRNDE